MGDPEESGEVAGEFLGAIDLLPVPSSGTGFPSYFKPSAEGGATMFRLSGAAWKPIRFLFLNRGCGEFGEACDAEVGLSFCRFYRADAGAG